MNKQFRHDKILQLIREEEIFTQDDLVKGLRKLGVRATQVTLSRDLHELGVAKTADGYRVIEAAAPEENQFHRTMIDFLRDVRRAQNLVILKTTTGSAQPVAHALDRENWPEIVGTIAGDDTILVIAATNRKASVIAERLLSELK